MVFSVDPLSQAPLLQAVHCAHPDVDIVLLPDRPQEQPRTIVAMGGTSDAVNERDAVEALVDRFSECLAAAAADAAGSVEPTPMDELQARHRSWETGSEPDTVLPVITDRLMMSDPATGIAAGAGLRNALLGDGWDYRVVQREPVVQVSGDLSGRQLRVVWLDDAVLVTVWGRPVGVDTELARDLLTGKVEGCG